MKGLNMLGSAFFNINKPIDHFNPDKFFSISTYSKFSINTY